MAADLPENYEGHPAFQFIVDVPADWETTQVPHGEIGEYITIVRKDRISPDWYIGSITNEKPRQLSLELDFLDEGASYVIEIYEDGPQAHYDTNPHAYQVSTWRVDREMTLNIHLALGGGYAARIHPVSDDDEDLPPVYSQ
jgi:alpha-glucosidase